MGYRLSITGCASSLRVRRGSGRTRRATNKWGRACALCAGGQTPWWAHWDGVARSFPSPPPVRSLPCLPSPAQSCSQWRGVRAPACQLDPERVPRTLSFGVGLDGSRICRGRTDGMSGLGSSAARGGTGSWEAPGVAGTSRHPRRHGTALECVAVGPRACFPGGLAVPRFSLVPGLRPRPSPALSAFPLARAGDHLRPLPLSGTEPVSPHAGVVTRTPLAGGALGPREVGRLAGHGEVNVRAVGAPGRGGRAFSRAGCGSGRWRRWARAQRGRPAGGRGGQSASWVPREGPCAGGLRGETPRSAPAAHSLPGRFEAAPGPLAMARGHPTSTAGSVLPLRLPLRRPTWPHAVGVPSPSATCGPPGGSPGLCPGASSLPGRRGPVPLPGIAVCPPTSLRAGGGGSARVPSPRPAPVPSGG